MGMSVGGGGGGRGGRGHRRRGRHHAMISEINVTPMVDVMLVLLIIFMVAAPLLTVGVPVDLPETQAKAIAADTQPIEVSINSAGQIYIQKTEIPIEELVAKLQAISKTGYDERIFFRADKATNYGAALQVMARVQAAGYKNMSLISLQEQDQ
ncbi:ExbD/TolR family protein [Mesorhizobium escarrei]|uniref:Biopolymer transport protein ExbD/TolR n=1 Tax=Mesorhizobium escarrei TaxID=666018 RepID=A0ABN8JZJ3_9HYPH|nr:biopolymer transporter ExbD [Mesorhizobium escarrei]CAH2403449.1 Biopolymer transport protein ExbD/TolR [Mesorhizobium escarrei]